MANTDPFEILLAEDNPIDAELAIRALRDHQIHDPLRWVKDGQEALDYLLAEGTYMSRKGAPSPRLIILDIKMPRISGIEVLRKLKADTVMHRIPIVMMSSFAEHPDMAEAYRLGIHSYVVKSADFEGFTHTVAKVLRLTRPPPI